MRWPGWLVNPPSGTTVPDCSASTYSEIKELQRILGNFDIRVNLRYVHFAPDHLEDALVNNPLSILHSKTAAKSGDKMATEDPTG